MNTIVMPAKLGGTINSIPSKSHVHRLLICAALASGTTEINCSSSSEDIDATARCLASLCADIKREESVFVVDGSKNNISAWEEKKTLACGESGSTYRFLFPVACALGGNYSFLLKGRLPERPMDPLFNELEKKGIKISGKGTGEVSIEGKLQSGVFTIPGDISSQFISGLIFALPLLEGDSRIQVTGTLESRKYIDITLSAVRSFGINIYEENNVFTISGNQTYKSPGGLTSEGDWSNAAFWLCCSSLSGKAVTCSRLSLDSLQGDKEICNILKAFGADVVSEDDSITLIPKPLKGITVDASQVPDLVPAIAAVATGAQGKTCIQNAGRLRLKESDRLKAVSDVLSSLGASIEETEDGLIIEGTGKVSGGTAHSWGDHRIAMMAAIMSTISDSPIKIIDSQAVNKSYPAFFEDLRSLGGEVITED